MHICIVGGIFDKPASYRVRHSISPETVLADGLREQGCTVTVCGHSAALPTSDDADIIHVHHFGRAALRLATAIRRPPFVFTTHDPFAMNSLPVAWKRRFADRYVLRHADAVVALSAAERDFLIRRYALPSCRITVIPNGIPTTVFDRVPEPAPSAPANSFLLFVGQLQKFKGLDFLLDALPAVRASYPQVRLRLVYQTGALLRHYQAVTGRLGLTGCVEFAGPQPSAALAQLYSAATLVVSPSLGECLSTVVLEAMGCGATVVATDVGGIREQLDDDTGVIVPPRDASALSRAICGLLADPARRQRLGQAAREKARAQFSVPKMIRRHLRLYESLLETDERAA